MTFLRDLAAYLRDIARCAIPFLHAASEPSVNNRRACTYDRPGLRAAVERPWVKRREEAYPSTTRHGVVEQPHSVVRGRGLDKGCSPLPASREHHHQPAGHARAEEVTLPGLRVVDLNGT